MCAAYTAFQASPIVHQPSITLETASLCGERLQVLEQMFRGTALLLELQFRW
jgi:hypothetical protein